MSRGRSAARRDYASDRAWLLAFIEAAPRELDGLGGSRLAGADQFAAGFDIPTMCDAATAFLAAADARMERGSAAGRASVGAMVAAYRCTLASTPMAARLAEIAERAVELAEDDGAEIARDSKAVLDSATLAIARPLILAAMGANGRVLNRDKLLAKVNATLTATKDRNHKPRQAITLRTLGRWIKKVKKDRLSACLAE